MAGTSSWERPSSTDLSPPTARGATVSIPSKTTTSARHSGKLVRNATTKAEIIESLIEPSAKQSRRRLWHRDNRPQRWYLPCRQRRQGERQDARMRSGCQTAKRINSPSRPGERFPNIARPPVKGNIEYDSTLMTRKSIHHYHILFLLRPLQG